MVVEAVHNYLNTVGGIGRTTKARARAAARSLQHSISAEVEKTSGRLGLVRADELAEIRSELTEIKSELADARSGLADARSELAELRGRPERSSEASPEQSDATSNGAPKAAVAPARATTAKKAVRKTAAKKTVAKKAAGKLPVAKKPAATKAPAKAAARKTPARKAEKATE